MTEIRQRRTTRLQSWDYSWPWWYYLTLCTHKQECILGEVVNEKMVLSALGRIVEGEWLRTPSVRPEVELDEFVIMPNHVHGIIIIGEAKNNEDHFVGTHGRASEIQTRRGLIHQTRRGETWAQTPSEGFMNEAPTKDDWILMKRKETSLGKSVREFKARTTRLIHKVGGTSFQWQRNYYDHIIRNETDLHRIRTYVANNPLQWAFDEENLDNAHRQGRTAVRPCRVSHN